VSLRRGQDYHARVTVPGLPAPKVALGGDFGETPREECAMRNRWLALVAGAILVLGACSQGASPTPGGGSPGGSPGTTAAAGGTAVLTGWRATPEEGEALTTALLAFQGSNQNVKVEYQPLAGDYRALMITKFSSKEVPDLFYVNAEYAPEWIDQGLLFPLDDMIAQAGLDTSKFYPGYLDVFKGKDGKTYGLPKDGNTLGMAYNTEVLAAAGVEPPTTYAELIAAADKLKTAAGIKAPLCLNAGLDRGLMFIYGEGGSLVNDDKSQVTIDSPETKAAVQWYTDLFKNKQGVRAKDLGAGWCGEALGKGDVAITFEGGWLDPYMQSTFPKIKYAWAEVPAGSKGKVTLAYTVSYSIGADSKNKEGAFELLKYLAGPEGMEKWTAGGVALPSRTDVPIPKGKDVLAKGSEYAKPGAGFISNYVEIQKAFADKMDAEITAGTFSADAIIAAAKPKIEQALNQ
jgi:multiple sugar transport system substrate-binding protein